MDSTYRAAIIGLGSISRAHMAGYRGDERVRVVAAADPHPMARQAFKEEFGLDRFYPDPREMMAREKPDIVSVCTWHGLHAEGTIVAAEGGARGIICEKPMCLGLEEADRMIAACEARRARLVIGHQRRFAGGWERSRQLIAEGAIGQVLFIESKVRDGLLNWATHTIDGMRYVQGDPDADWVMGAVERNSDRYERNVAIEDCCMGLIRFKNGAQALVQSDLTEEGGAGGFLVRGSEGLLRVDEGSVNLFNAQTGGWKQIDTPHPNQHVSQAKELIAWIEGGPEHRSSGLKARAVVEILMAVYESARRNEVARLPLRETGYPLKKMIDEGALPVRETGAYDIRGFLVRGSEDERLMNEMRTQGKGHWEMMAELRRRARERS